MDGVGVEEVFVSRRCTRKVAREDVGDADRCPCGGGGWAGDAGEFKRGGVEYVLDVAGLAVAEPLIAGPGFDAPPPKGPLL